MDRIRGSILTHILNEMSSVS